MRRTCKSARAELADGRDGDGLPTLELIHEIDGFRGHRGVEGAARTWCAGRTAWRQETGADGSCSVYIAQKYIFWTLSTGTRSLGARERGRREEEEEMRGGGRACQRHARDDDDDDADDARDADAVNTKETDIWAFGMTVYVSEISFRL